MDKKLLTIWQYLRGDITTEVFEDFIYNEPDLAKMLGEELYLEVISTDYREPHQVDNIKKKIASYAELFFEYSCQCHQISNKDIISMGLENEFFSTFTTIKERDKTHFWLHIDQCIKCQQRWLIADEGIYNDDYYLYRLSDEEYTCIIDENKWPELFNHYEYLSSLSQIIGGAHNDRGPDRSTIPSIMYELAGKNPEIIVKDLAQLLDIPLNETIEIARELTREKHVSISMPNEKNQIRKISCFFQT